MRRKFVNITNCNETKQWSDKLQSHGQILEITTQLAVDPSAPGFLSNQLKTSVFVIDANANACKFKRKDRDEQEEDSLM